MKGYDVILAVGIAFGFTAWPVFGRFANSASSWMATIALGMTAITVAFLSRHEFSSAPNFKAVMILVVVGVMNGAAVYFYAKRVADPEVALAVFLVLVSIFMTAWAPFLDWVLNGSAPSLRQIAGFVCAATTVYLLSE